MKRIADDVSDSSQGSGRARVLGARRSGLGLGARHSAYGQFARAGLSPKWKQVLNQQRLRPRRASEASRAAASGRGPASIEKCWLVNWDQAVAENGNLGCVCSTPRNREMLSEPSRKLIHIGAAAARAGSAAAHLRRRLRTRPRTRRPYRGWTTASPGSRCGRQGRQVCDPQSRTLRTDDRTRDKRTRRSAWFDRNSKRKATPTRYLFLDLPWGPTPTACRRFATLAPLVRCDCPLSQRLRLPHRDTRRSQHIVANPVAVSDDADDEAVLIG